MGVFRLFFITNCDKDHKISSFLLCDRCFSSKTGLLIKVILKILFWNHQDYIVQYYLLEE